ncbi:MAG: hypothetical protein ACI88H_001979 [Cocleimonas sp.]|jgi:hypothetical protein
MYSTKRLKDCIDELAAKDGMLPLTTRNGVFDIRRASMSACDKSEMFLLWLSLRQSSLHELFMRDLMAIQSDDLGDSCSLVVAMLDCIDSGAAQGGAEASEELLLLEIKKRLSVIQDYSE